MNQLKRFRYHDANIWVDYEEPDALFRGLMQSLRRRGYVVAKDPRIEKDYPILSKWHRYISRVTPAGLFECKAHWYPRGFSLECFQNIVFENPNGGEYDFNRLRKMPFLIRMRFIHFRQVVSDYLISRGVEFRPDCPPDATPLEKFNAAWTAERFSRGPDGWPDANELKSWSQVTSDGVRIHQGMLAYCVSRGRRWVCGRLYGGINGMWIMYDQRNRLVENHNAAHYYANFDEVVCKGRVVSEDQRIRAIRRDWDQSLRKHDYDRIAELASVAKRFSLVLI